MSQTVLRSQQRSQIAIPAQGMIEFRDALTDLLDEFGTDDHGQFFHYRVHASFGFPLTGSREPSFSGLAAAGSA